VSKKIKDSELQVRKLLQTTETV